jgi:acetolactate synthase I/II/III large subunit
MKPSGARALLEALKSVGVDYVFCNPGSDFAPVIEELALGPADDFPQFFTVVDERLAPALAHGLYLAAGQMAAIMVHVNVGLANTVMGLINARSDDIPMFVLSGKTPLSTGQRTGARDSPIQYGQEMYDQGALVREVAKWSFELRHPETMATLVRRGAAIAKTAPCGPVYLSLPREPLAETFAPDPLPEPAQQPAGPAVPTQAQVLAGAALLAGAARPLILCQRGDLAGEVGRLLSQIGNHQQIPVAENFATRNVMATSDGCFIGHGDPEVIGEADVIVVVDAAVAWIQSATGLATGAKVVHLGPDPLFTRLPTRTFQSDLTLCGDVAATLSLLQAALASPGNLNLRRSRLTSLRKRYRAMIVTQVEAAEDTITKPMVAKILSGVLGEGARIFSERGAPSPYYNLAGPNRFFGNTHAGGLGWPIGAALGAQLADRLRPAIAVIGDGGYMLANPVACHQFAEANGLPILTLVLNNGAWGAVRASTKAVYPDGAAAKADKMPLAAIQSLPDFCAIAKASNAWTAKVVAPEALAPAIKKALFVMENEKRQALLDVTISD